MDVPKKILVISSFFFAGSEALKIWDSESIDHANQY